MSDSMDRGVELNELVTQSLIAQRKPVEGIVHSGECHFCYEPVEAPKLFCDNKCADQYEKLKERS